MTTIGTGRKSKKCNECLYIHNSIYERISHRHYLKSYLLSNTENLSQISRIRNTTYRKIQ